jgi:hypothetical protein
VDVANTDDHNHTDEHTNGYIQQVVISGADICPSCQNVSLERIEGCHKCGVCGYSEC